MLMWIGSGSKRRSVRQTYDISQFPAYDPGAEISRRAWSNIGEKLKN